jgi:hypothetical protein
MIDVLRFGKNLEGEGRGLIKYHPEIFLEWLRKTTRNLSQDSLCSGRNSNTTSLEQKSTALHPDHYLMCWSRDNIKMDLEGMGCEGVQWNYKAQNTIQCLALANAVMNLQVLL